MRFHFNRFTVLALVAGALTFGAAVVTDAHVFDKASHSSDDAGGRTNRMTNKRW